MPIGHDLKYKICFNYQLVYSILIDKSTALIRLCILLLFLKDILYFFWPGINLIVVIIIYILNMDAIFSHGCFIYEKMIFFLSTPSLEERVDYIINPATNLINKHYSFKRFISIFFSSS